jgi:hypothetical protein
LLFAQEDSLTFIPLVSGKEKVEIIPIKDIYISSKSTEKGLQLRWAPSNADLWLKGNTHGYTIEKIILDSTGTQKFKSVGKKIFKPWPMEQWKPLVSDKTPYSAAAAMALYGKDNSSSGFAAANENLQNKFGFALLSADLDKKAAEASGLSYLDTDVDKNSFYVYRIYIVDSTNKAISDTTNKLMIFTDPKPIMSPELLLNSERENEITLSWEKNNGVDRYSAYYIERSDNGGQSFDRINKTPYLDVSTNLMIDNAYITFTDSIDQQYFEYQYRLIGLDAFGDESTPDNVVSAMGRDQTPPLGPNEISIVQTQKGYLQINWKYTVVDTDFNGFKIYKSYDPDEYFHEISELLPSTTRMYIDKEPDTRETNYYRIMAIDTSGNEGASMTEFGITTDDIPPGPPFNLKASIDTLGQLLLTWEAPIDKDIRGYLVHYSNSKDEAYAVKPGGYLQNSYFVDVLNLNTLTEEIYYYVVAVDHSYNVSNASEIIKVKKPDLIPPAPSIFADYDVTEDGIFFKWIKSTSVDVAKVELKRKTIDKDWIKIEQFDENTDSYIDKNVVEGIYYEYSLFTHDDDGNVTESEKPLSLSALKSFYLKDTPTLEGKSEKEIIRLTISYPSTENVEFIIFRAVDENPLTSYQTLKIGSVFEDVYVDNKVKYTYAVKARAKDGRDSRISLPIKIKK